MAAIMLAEIHLGYPLPKLKERLESEKHTYGWGYLSDEEGKAAEAAFHKLMEIVEKNKDVV